MEEQPQEGIPAGVSRLTTLGKWGLQRQELLASHQAWEHGSVQQLPSGAPAGCLSAPAQGAVLCCSSHLRLLHS